MTLFSVINRIRMTIAPGDEQLREQGPKAELSADCNIAGAVAANAA